VYLFKQEIQITDWTEFEKKATWIFTRICQTL